MLADKAMPDFASLHRLFALPRSLCSGLCVPGALDPFTVGSFQRLDRSPARIICEALQRRQMPLVGLETKKPARWRAKSWNAMVAGPSICVAQCAEVLSHEEAIAALATCAAQHSTYKLTSAFDPKQTFPRFKKGTEVANRFSHFRRVWAQPNLCAKRELRRGRQNTESRASPFHREIP